MARTLEIDEGAVVRGIADATEIIGRKLLDQQIFNAIRSKKYQSILRKMMGAGAAYRFRRSDVTKEPLKNLLCPSPGLLKSLAVTGESEYYVDPI